MNLIKRLFTKKETTKQCDIHVVSCSSVNKEHLDDLILKWQYTIRGNPKDNLQVIALEACINDLKIIMTAYCN